MYRNTSLLQRFMYLFGVSAMIGLFALAGKASFSANSLPQDIQQPRSQSTVVYESLVVGIPFEDIGTVQDAGAVNIIPGSPDGLTGTGAQGWDREARGVEGTAAKKAWFGFAVASGDFNGDGYPDLAVGVPGESPTGSVHVFYGTAVGITAQDDVIITPVVRPENNVYYGAALAVGDFDGDGYDDLAIGDPYEKATDIPRENDGGVEVIYGSAQGLNTRRIQWWDIATIGYPSAFYRGHRFGQALAVGDFDGDGYDDLAIGAPGDDTSGYEEAGSVIVIYGSDQRLNPNWRQIWHQDQPDMAGGAETGDNFGAVLAVGDFDADGYDDLAIGIPFEDVRDVSDAGAVQIIHGSYRGLTAQNSQIWDQDSQAIFGRATKDNHFGKSLASGDFNGDGYDDLAIGAPEEDILTTYPDAGVVHLLHGSEHRLFAPQDNILHLWEANVLFGAALTSGDFDGDGYDDLAVGAPDYKNKRGAVYAYYGTTKGLGRATSEKWDQDSPGVPGIPEVGDAFGTALTILPVVCAQDPYEPNNLASEAYDTENDFQQHGGFQIMDNAYICPSGDVDWFLIPASTGETIEISLTSLPKDYDMALFDPDGSLVGLSQQNGTVNEYISHKALKTGKYQLRILGGSSAEWHPNDGYSLQVIVRGTTPPTPTPTPTPIPCPDTRYEPNDDFDTAAIIGYDTPIEGYICTPDDEDWYAIEVERGKVVEAILGELPADYDLYLYDPSGTLLETSREGDTSPERIVFTAPISGAYRLRVFGYGGAYNPNVPYILRVTQQEASSPVYRHYIPSVQTPMEVLNR